MITDIAPSPNKIFGLTLKSIMPASITPPKTNLDKSKVYSLNLSYKSLLVLLSIQIFPFRVMCNLILNLHACKVTNIF